ncbi:UDP-N-acetylmuramoyl-L-alanyl-D-glutamate--2,6-diaminopimelate ligase [Aciduricibacillus chroicocephali]|uniref:UDP-N-acetylmuramoyl-L-alanyl-D-glutamate--2,6-diaminopimelate ligase n=1 Tax=Aciduricibacillus chroicocephali TaxID=3054939 RepID=A0ABY9KXZ4_9BACI|nr:UDP-N-acetylmuramoyl-L-alanyl-D-glutamate--2,6-diaminopimelate ligase [Bacillaceae bacterium 44XB]
MKLGKLIESLPFSKCPEGSEQIEIETIEMDSRAARSGALFVCVKGFTVDGHDFASQAEEKGAAAIIAERPLDVSVPVIIVSDTTQALAELSNCFYGEPTRNMNLIGVTGTNGKTTVTYLLEQIFNRFNQKTGIIGTIQMKIGDETIPSENTTPDALLLQKTFHKMQDAHVDTAIMEVSSHALDLGRVHGCDFDVAIFTNLSQDHLDYHKDMDEYLHAKSLLFSRLGNIYGNTGRKFAILNADDKHFDYLKRSTAQHILAYGIENDADIKAENVELAVTHTAFKLVTPLGETEIYSHLIGMFNIYNMLAAAGAAIAKGVPLNIIKEAFEAIPGVDGRFEAVREGQDFAVIVDYAHTPDSLENVLLTIKEFAKGKVYVVVGCGGDRDRSKRPLMAGIAVKHADQAILTSDNPRTEDPDRILDDMAEGLDPAVYTRITDRKEAIEHAVNLAEPNDIILIAGKGHETYQIIGHTKIDFDDRVAAREAIRRKGE